MGKRRKTIFRTMTAGRVWNYFLLRTSFRISDWFKRPIHWGTPVAVSIEPTTACNLRCPQCPSGLRKFTRPQGNLDPDMNEKILEQLGKNLQYVNYYFQGEPFIHPNFLDLVHSARKRNIYVVTSTNAHFINEKKAEDIVDSGLSEIIVSIDGTTQKTYENYRIEGNLEKVINGTENLVKAKKKVGSDFPIITFQFLVTRQNEHQINELHKLADEVGADEVRLKTIQVYDFENGNDLIPQNEKHSRYRKKKDGSYSLKNKFRSRCWKMWSSCVFTWDGRIVPCCFDKDADHQMGELSQEDFREVWKSSVYKGFRQEILKNRQQIEICKNCSEGSKIWV